MTRLRVVAYQVLPVLVLDDGENLSPVPPTNPLVVPAADWANVHAIVETAISGLQTTLDSAP